MKTINSNELSQVSMLMIASAGEGRDLIQTALDKLNENEIEQSNELLNEAFEKIKKAHIAQTKVIQNEMGYEEQGQGSELLFTHAQDTLMTINSEYYTAKKMVQMFASLEKRIKVIERAIYENDK